MYVSYERLFRNAGGGGGVGNIVCTRLGRGLTYRPTEVALIDFSLALTQRKALFRLGHRGLPPSVAHTTWTSGSDIKEHYQKDIINCTFITSLEITKFGKDRINVKKDAEWKAPSYNSAVQVNH